MIFSDVPGATVSRQWSQVSVLYSNVFRLRSLSLDNLFRIAIGVGFSDGEGIPVIISSKTAFVQSAVWQELKVPVISDYRDTQLYIFARISDVQWGTKGPVQFALQEGDSMIYSQGATVGDDALRAPLVENHGSVMDVKSEGSQGPYGFPSVEGRESGFIRSQYPDPIWVYFSDSVDPTRPYSAMVPGGGAIDFPGGYEGGWVVDPGAQEVSDLPSLSYVEYVRSKG